jgi:nitronate monooxygenase
MLPPADTIAGAFIRELQARIAAAEAAGADALCVQGPEAGAHRGSFGNELRADDLGLLPLLRRVSAATTLPMIATGGLADGRDVAAVLAAGASAAQLGTAFLACPESGASPLHKAALTDPAFERTAVTRAFSGRPARGLANRFLLEHGAAAPAAYPHVHHVTRAMRRAAAAAGDPHGGLVAPSPHVAVVARPDQIAVAHPPTLAHREA